MAILPQAVMSCAGGGTHGEREGRCHMALLVETWGERGAQAPHAVLEPP